MAGISFQIEKLLKEETWTATFKSYFHSGIIAAGPWMFSVLTILILNIIKPDNFLQTDFLKFTSILVHIFALSLIVTGFLYHSLTRYIADKLYIDTMASLNPTLNSFLLFIFVIQLLVGIFYFGNMNISFSIKMLSILTYLTISALWIVMIFLTTLKNYNFITFTFLGGSILTIFICYILSRYLFLGLTGYFIGYFLGYFWIMTNLVAYMFQSFHSQIIFDWNFFKISNLEDKYTLILSGFFYSLGIWIDKIVFWKSKLAVVIVEPFISSYPIYDSVIFFAYITIIPSLIIFFLHIETNFYKVYHFFYSVVLQEGTFENIKECKKEMFKVLKLGMRNILFYQGTITFLFIIFSDKIINLLNMQSIQIPIFRICVLAGFMHVLFLIALMIILYFDFKKLAMWMSLLFLILSFLFSYLNLFFDVRFLGIGYFLSSFISLIVAFYCFIYKFNRLEYDIYISQVFKGEARR